MKIRNGFVSNSSSSSFLIIGAEISDLSDEFMRSAIESENCEVGEDVKASFYNMLYRKNSNISLHEYKGGHVLGIDICRIDDDDIGSQEESYSFEDLKNYETELKEKFSFIDKCRVYLIGDYN